MNALRIMMLDYMLLRIRETTSNVNKCSRFSEMFYDETKIVSPHGRKWLKKKLAAARPYPIQDINNLYELSDTDLFMLYNRFMYRYTRQM